jgi:uncharacterized repeat protein (TIGR01451 family)
MGGIALLCLALSGMALADPIDPPAGYPKLKLSVKTVTPTLAHTGGMSLAYIIEIRNTGAYTAMGTQLMDVFPLHTTYNGDVDATTGTTPTVTSDTLAWTGDVDFDATALLSFSVTIDEAYAGPVTNTAIISHPMIAEPVTVTAVTMVTDKPILVIEKTSSPAKPGANKPLTYTLKVRNLGQPAENLPITVTDQVPEDTTLRDIGANGVSRGTTVTWTRQVSLEQGASTVFTFSVDVANVPSGTVITNDTYQVSSAETEISAGAPYTTTVIDPIFRLFKSVQPDPPGSNRELTYTITVVNLGSLATDLVISDRVPSGVEYHRGGDSSTFGFVRWQWPNLDTSESAEFSFTGYINDVLGVNIVNDDYEVCSAEGVCASGDPFTSVVHGPMFEALVTLDPIAKKPGGGAKAGPVTPTLTVYNAGPGNALDAQATLYFTRISVSARDLVVIPDIGAVQDGPNCGEKCVAYAWTGELAYGETVTFTTREGQSTIGGEEGTTYTATVVITDGFSNDMQTLPVSATAIGKITHHAYLQPRKSAPPVIGRGQIMTYTINVANTALAAEETPLPYLWDFVPDDVEVLEISHGGVSGTYTMTTGTNIITAQVISWTLPALGTGEVIDEPRWFKVRVASDLVSGTKLINTYRTHWYESDGEVTGWFSATGKPVTTTVVDVGLIDSFKAVTPTLVSPGPGNILTYVVHIVNSSPVPLQNIKVEDDLPWEASTYQKDAIASAGTIVSDIVSLQWTGSVAAFSEELITFTVLVDADYKGAVVNTASITHTSLLETVEVEAIAYVTDKPELHITKRDNLNKNTGILEYTITVENLGQAAEALVITDTIPSNVTYVAGSAGSGVKVGNLIRWTHPFLDLGASQTFKFSVDIGDADRIVNDDYAVKCENCDKVSFGDPVITTITEAPPTIYLPLVMRNAS